jgi:type III restriction enzyme
VVLWFTDDPSLNEQTRFRLLEAADRIAHSRPGGDREHLRAGEAGAGQGLLPQRAEAGQEVAAGRGAPGADEESAQIPMSPPDTRAFTMWDILANTIRDEQLTLYLILDEAHRGMKPPSKSARAEKATIVQRLVNGAQGRAAGADRVGHLGDGRALRPGDGEGPEPVTYPAVVVDSARVQESGLLKDDIRLDFPAETGSSTRCCWRAAPAR